MWIVARLPVYIGKCYIGAASNELLCKHADLIIPLPAGNGTEDEEECAEKLKTNIQEAHDAARKVMKLNVGKMKRAYDVKLWTRQYDPGDAVYMLDSATAKGKFRKLVSTMERSWGGGTNDNALPVPCKDDG